MNSRQQDGGTRFLFCEPNKRNQSRILLHISFLTFFSSLPPLAVLTDSLGRSGVSLVLVDLFRASVKRGI